MTNADKLMQERAKAFEAIKALSAKAEAEERDFNTEEQVSYDKMIADTKSLLSRANRLKAEEDFAKELATKRDTVDPLMNGRSSVTVAGTVEGTPEYRSAFAQYIRTGDNRVFRDLNTTTPGDGGYAIPTEVSKTITTELLRGSVMRRAGAKVLTTGLRANILVGSHVTPSWEPERDPYGNNADTDPTLGQFLAAPRKATMRTTISEELFNDSDLDIEGYVRQLFLDAYAQFSDDAYVNGVGSGSNQPNGIFLTGTDKLVTSVTTFSAAELVAHFFALPAQYRNSKNCAWIASDLFIGRAATLAVDVANGVIFEYATVAGEPDKLQNKPIFSSSAVTTTWAANAEVAVIADISQYQIVDFSKYSLIKRLSELSALSGAENIIARYATDGKLLFADAARVMKMATS